jgi:putative endonuclease
MYLYILKSKVGKKSYVGVTNNPTRRIKEHNSAKTGYTSKFKPWGLLKIEKFKSEKEAAQKEKYYKSRQGRRELKKLFET